MARKTRKADAVTVTDKSRRKGLFTQERADEICARVSEGEPLAAVCRDMGIGLSTVYDWMGVHQEFAGAIARARVAGFDMIALEALKIADTPVDAIREKSTKDGIEITREDALGHRKLQVETRLKLLAKWDPKRYGDKLAIGGAEDLPPVQQNVTLDPSEAYKRLLGGGGA